MAKGYSDWLSTAELHRKKLDDAIADGDAQKIIYYRGKYLFALKQAYKLLPTGMVTKNVTGYGYDTSIDREIKVQLNNHARQIEKSIKDNKRSSSVRNSTLNRELALKLRRLSTRATQINFAASKAEHDQAVKDVTDASLGLAGGVVKAPIMAASKVVYHVGPYAVLIAAAPFALFSALLAFTVDLYNGKVSDEKTFDNAVIVQMTKNLMDGVKQISKVTYEKTGRI